MIPRIQWPSLEIQGLKHGVWDPPVELGIWCLRELGSECLDIAICAPVVGVSGSVGWVVGDPVVKTLRSRS